MTIMKSKVNSLYHNFYDFGMNLVLMQAFALVQWNKNIVSSRIKMGFVITFSMFYAALSARNKITDLQNKKSHI
jgi:hypothetical protein